MYRHMNGPCGKRRFVSLDVGSIVLSDSNLWIKFKILFGILASVLQADKVKAYHATERYHAELGGCHAAQQ
jgi:hypothetical protein